MSDTTTAATTTTAAPDAGAAGSGATAAPASWSAGLPDELKGYVELKGFKDPGSVVESYKNLEKLMGAPKERLLTLPEKHDAPEWEGIYDRLGRPKEAKEYSLPVPEGGDKEATAWVADTFHKLGLSRTQGEQLYNNWNAYAKAQADAQNQKFEQQLQADQEAIKKEWGAAYQQDMSRAQRAAREFGVTEEMFSALGQTMGYKNAMNFFKSIGSKFSEDSFVTPEQKSTGFGSVLSPAAAKAKIDMLKSDNDFLRRFNDGESAAKNMWSTLHQWAFPENA